MQLIKSDFDIGWGAAWAPGHGPLRPISGPLRYKLGPGAGRVIESVARAGYSDYIEGYTLDTSLVARTASETRPQNVTGCYLIKAFGVVVNPGSANAAQLASDLATLQAGIQTDLGFTILYPGRQCCRSGQCDHKHSLRHGESLAWFGRLLRWRDSHSGNWTCTGWRWLGSADLNTQGLAAGQYGDSIVVQTGQTALWNRGDWQGSPVLRRPPMAARATRRSHAV